MQSSRRVLQVFISVVTILSTVLGTVPWVPVTAVRAAENGQSPSMTTTADTGATTASHMYYLPLVMNRYTTPTVKQIDPDEGGSLITSDESVALTFAPKTLTETLTVTYQALSDTPDKLPVNQQIVGHAFRLTAQTPDGHPVTQFRSNVTTHTVATGEASLTSYTVTNTVVITMTYTDAEIAGLDEQHLQIFTRGQGESWKPLLTVVDPQANLASAPLNHFSDFALLGSTAVPTETWVILDPDHGGEDPGGTVTAPASYVIQEKFVNLDTALAVKGYLETCGVNVLMTREEDASISSTWRETFIKNADADAVATIGTNIATHTMQYFVGGPMGLADFSKPEDQTFAQTLVNAISDTTKLPSNRGVQNAQTWRGGIYLPTHLPDTLYAQIETAYLDSYYDRDHVIDPKLEYIAGGIYNGIIAQLELTACIPFSGTVADTTQSHTLGISDAGIRYTAQGVNPATGNQFQWFRDLFVPGPGLNVDVVRYYNSQSTDVGLFGKGWSSLYDMEIESLADGVLQVKYADGHRVNFTPEGSAYQPEPGTFDSLARENSEYVLTTPSQIRFIFSTSGVLQRIEDKSSSALALQYDGTHLDAIVDAAGRIFDVTTNAAGLVTAITDPANRVITYTYGIASLARTQHLQSLGNVRIADTSTDLLAMTNANGGQTQYAYDPAGGYLNQVTDPQGITYLENVYTPDGKVQSQKNGNSDQGTWDYDLENMRSTFTDNEGQKTIYYFDSNYRVIKEQDALNYTTLYEYDANGNVTAMTDKRGNTWHYTYDDQGNMLTRTDPLDQWSLYDSDMTTWTYDTENNPTSMTDSLGNTWTYEYDGKGNPTHITEPNGAETFAEYDDKGQMTKLTDAESRVTTFVYDEDGNRTETHYADGGWTKSTYDDAGHGLTNTICLNPPLCTETSTISNEYDGNGNITKQTDPLGHVTTFEYDKNNMLVKKVDRRGGVWTWEYDDELNPTKETDPLGQITTHTYNKMSKHLSTTDAELRTTSFVYDALYRMIQVTDPADGIYTYTYDPNGNLLTFTDPMDYRTHFTYDVANRRKFVRDAIGGTTEYCYDPLDRIVQAFDPRRAEVQLTYDSVGNQVEVIDPLGSRMVMVYDKVHNMTRQTVGIPSDGVAADGATTTMIYDMRNRVITRTDPLGRTTHTAYDGAGNVVTMTDPMGFVTTFAYNKHGWMTAMTDALGGVTRYEYDPEGAATAMVDARGNTTRYEYDKLEQLVRVIDPLDQATRFEYDKAGNQTAVINALDKTTHYTYDALNLLVKETDPLGNETTYAYDALRRMTARTDANGIATHYGHNALGWLTIVTDAEDGTTTYEYDEVGNRTAIIDANGVETAFEYNVLDQVVREINPLNKTWEYSYDARGNMVRRVDGKWQATYYEYDKADQLIATVYGEGANTTAVTFEYDDNGNEIAMHDWNGDWSYSYDALNRRTSATDYKGRTLQWEYDAASNRTAMLYPDGQRVEMAYDAAGQLATLTDAQGRSHTWDYDPLGYITAQANPNGTQAAYTYDAAGRLTSLSNTGPGDTIITGYAYTLDAVGNRIQTTEQRGPETTTRSYEYDDLYRLTRAQTNTGQDMAYVYDPVGNRLQKAGVPEASDTHPAEPEDTLYSYNALNSMLTAGPIHFDYDDNGSRVRKTEPLTASNYISVALASGWEITGSVVTDYGYDYENRLTEVTRIIHYTDALSQTAGVSETMHAAYVYDGYGRRVEKHVTTAITETAVLSTATVFTREYVFDGLDPVVEYDYEDNTITPTLTSAYTYGNSRMVLLEHTPEGSPTESYWYHYDGLGSVVALTDESGADVCQWTYDEYGNLLQDCPALNHYTYTGQEIDPETGLLHFFARYYDAQTSIWISQDKYRGTVLDPLSLTRYVFVQNNPILYRDSYGYFLNILVGAGVGAIVGAGVGALSDYTGQVASNRVEGKSIKDSLTQVNTNNIIASAAGGAVQGAICGGIAGATGGIGLASCGAVGTIIGGATGNATTSITYDLLEGEKDVKKIAQNAGNSFVTGGIINAATLGLGEKLPIVKTLIGKAVTSGALGVSAELLTNPNPTPRDLLKSFTSGAARSTVADLSFSAASKTINYLWPIEIKIKGKYSEYSKHVTEAQIKGLPDKLKIDRTGANDRRAESLKDVPTKSSFDRDEYPPAMFKQGGTGASVKYMTPSQNRGAGSSLRWRLSNFTDGTWIKLVPGNTSP